MSTSTPVFALYKTWSLARAKHDSSSNFADIANCMPEPCISLCHNHETQTLGTMERYATYRKMVAATTLPDMLPSVGKHPRTLTAR